MRVRLSRTDRSFSVAPGEPVLEAALRAGFNLPHSCKGGSCGACRARLLEGAVAYPAGRPLGLTEAEEADGLVLLCHARAESDLLIETFEAISAEEILIKRLPCRVERTRRLSHDVMALFLKLPAAEPFEFKPGQYVDIMLPKGRRRSFSIASPPHDARPLELHVRRAPGGEFTERVFAGEGIERSLLTLEGPLGHFCYRESAAPMLLLGECDIYASGPPAMIEAVRREFPMRGADPARLYFDSFDYAPDSSARQPTIADTRS